MISIRVLGKYYITVVVAHDIQKIVNQDKKLADAKVEIKQLTNKIKDSSMKYYYLMNMIAIKKKTSDKES